jgi:hypothetical protein
LAAFDNEKTLFGVNSDRSGQGTRVLFLGYKNTGLTDGAGAQLQRILGIYSISQILGCGYLHFGVEKIGYQGLSVLETGIEISNLAELYNRLLQLPSDRIAVSDFGDQVFFSQFPALSDILRLREQALVRRRPALLLMHLPYAVVDSVPGAYASVYGVISESAASRLSVEPFGGEFNRRDDEEVVVAVHVRRGELFAVDSDRMLANSYYLAVCKRIAGLLARAGRKFRVDLYTEVPRARFTVDGHSHGIANRISGRVQFSPDHVKISDFDQIDNIQYRINEHPVSTLFNLASADLLVGSRSSYSYVAAVAGTVKCVVMPRFWHASGTDWLESHAETGAFDGSKLIDMVSRQKQFARGKSSGDMAQRL